ncbi:protein disulfide-isomerase 5-3-like isoform X1 [Gossypium australe]|uniref:Protein disulfide-isomerase 5-3-like isoform X1 n=1 Tax=Gossypium australe TaxID=47621 RepID=A0A5B6WZB9_9ROSI|nr:protein disulfide-isomerase 5-3-like isoform X1 [Gossypium australe]
MFSSSKIKSVDFYRKIPRDLTEASLSGAGLSIIAALAMMFLFGMELNDYLTVSTTTSINRLNITKTIRKFSIDPHLRPTGAEFHSGPLPHYIKHGDEVDEETNEGSVALNSASFDKLSHQYQILVVNFYAPWCYWSTRLKPSWEKAAKIIKQRYDPEVDGRILLAKVDCTEEVDLCRRNHIQGYPSIRIFRKGSDVRETHGHHEHESYYGDRDTDTLVKTMEVLVDSIPQEDQKIALEDKSNVTKRPAPLSGGCRIEGYVRVKKVPGNLIISARSGSHSFDASKMNMSHVISHLSFGKTVSPQVLNDVKRLIPYLGRSHDKLNGRSFINHRDLDANVTIEHYLQVVKTEVVTTKSSHDHRIIEEYEYTAHSSLAQSVYIPVAKFHFELSPMQVLVTEDSKSFSHFLTNVCAIIGGVFTVSILLISPSEQHFLFVVLKLALDQ